MSKHAKYSPSKLSRILACPASGKYEQQQESSSYANEGTMLHEVSEKAMIAYYDNINWPKVVRDFKPALNAEQIEAVESAVEYVIEVDGDLGDNLTLLEKHVEIAPDCSGTADVIMVGRDELHILDYKFGKGIEVSANENTQLMAYAFGANVMHQRGTIILHVVQPRLSNYDTYVISKGNLDRWYEHTLLPGLALADSVDAPYVPSLTSCRWCPNKGKCSARMTAALSNATEVFAAHAKLPEIDMNNFGILLGMAKEIEACIKDFSIHAQHLLEKGQQVKGFKLVAGRSIRKWIDTDLAVEFMATHVDLEDLYETKLISPTKAEKLLPKDQRKDESFTSLVEKPTGRNTLAVESDKRPAITQFAAYAVTTTGETS